MNQKSYRLLLVSPAEDPPKPKVRLEREAAQQLTYSVPDAREVAIKVEPIQMPQTRFTYEEPPNMNAFNSYVPPPRMLTPYEIKRPIDEPSYNHQTMCAQYTEATTCSAPLPKKARRSRWAPDDQKVALPPPVALVQQPTMNCTAPIGTGKTNCR